MPANHRLTSARRSPGRIAAVLVLLFMVCAPALSACAPDPQGGDRVYGKIVAAQVPAADPKGPQLSVPGDLQGLASVADYNAAGKAGTQMTFGPLTFGQFNQLGDVVSQSFIDTDASMKATVARTGSVVALSGTIDLSSLATNSASVIMSVQFPGPVTATNGRQDSDDTVTWTVNGGSSANLTSEAHYADPSIQAFTKWSWICAFVGLLVAVVVGAIAYTQRDRSPRPGADGAGESLLELSQRLRQKLHR
ncbi:LppM family (lipo)protein [Tsukamurella soli]|uniref:Lipoprotein LppM n=1 Tax=Tsukamurella soli TaxID=644556 RepID=A0ABP8JGJ7_9ACTN